MLEFVMLEFVMLEFVMSVNITSSSDVIDPATIITTTNIINMQHKRPLNRRTFSRSFCMSVICDMWCRL